MLLKYELPAFLKNILNEIPAVVVVYRESILFANKYTLNKFGYSLDEIKQKHIWDFVADECEKEEIKNIVKKRISGELKDRVEKICKVKAKDGYAYLKAVGSSIELNGKVFGILTGIDITHEKLLEKSLKDYIEKIKNVDIPIIEVEVDQDGLIKGFLPLNNVIFKITGYSPEEFKNKDFFFNKIHPKDKKKFNPSILWRKDEIYTTFRFKKKNGRYLWIKEYIKVIERNKTVKFISTWLDITKEKRLEKRLNNTVKELKTIVNYSPDIIVKITKKGVIKFKSKAVESLGYNTKEVINKNIIDYIYTGDKDKFKYLLERAFNEKGKKFFIEYRVFNSKGEIVWLEGHLTVPEGSKYAYIVERDITEKKEAEDKLLKYTYYDPLTHLPNRILFIQTLKEIVKENKKIAVFTLKITNFNDLILLFPKGKFLNYIANELKSRLKEFILAKNIMPDEFLIAFNFRYLSEIDRKLSKIRNLFSKGIKINNEKIFVNYNIGVSIYPLDSQDIEEVIKNSELALYNSLKIGVNEINFFSKSIAEDYEIHLKILKNLPKAVSNKEFKVFYQPIFNLKTKKCVGFEALIRWFSPELGYVPPDKFIPLAEESDLIIEIGKFVMETSLKEISSLSKKHFLAVNFSAKQFENENLVDDIKKNLEKYNFNPENFIVEITERTAMKDPDKTKQIILKLKEERIKIALDDFGTGYSNMNYLVEFDIDKIKVDKSFTSKILENKKYRNIVKTIITLSHTIKATSLAEGIETEDMLNELIKLNCEEGQGYYFSQPVPVDDLLKILEKL